MSRGGRRQAIQLNEPARILYSNEPAHEEEDDDDSAGDMPTPERLVTDDMIPNRDGAVGPRMPYEIDNKVANFLAEIDALDPGQEVESTIAPAPPRPIEVRPPMEVRPMEVSPVRDKYSPARERSPVRAKPNAYSSMFVKGTPEFVNKPDEKKIVSGSKRMEPWPEEPKTDWQQLKDETTNYPYYWNTETNQVVWDMPPEFSQYLLRQKEYEEKVERGLREGTLHPDQKIKASVKKEPVSGSSKTVEPTKVQNNDVKSEVKSEVKHSSHRKRSRHSDDSADSSSDSSDSDQSPRRDSARDRRKKGTDKTQEVSSSSAENSRTPSNGKTKRSVTPELPDSTKSEESKKEPVVKKVEADDSIDFDIDDIDKELELALERKRQELMKLEEKKTEEKTEEGDKGRHKDRKKDERRHRDDDRKEDRHRKHGKHRDSDRDRKHHGEESKEEKKPKLTLKERLRIEMELKLEKEKRKKQAIEDLMARELEQTVGGRSHKRLRDDREKPMKHYHHDDGRGDRRGPRDDYREYDRGYDAWQGRGARPYDDRFVPPPMMKPPPPTDEMIAYEEERRSQAVDYGHGRSRSYDVNGESDGEEARSADFREMEIKKLEALQLAELALSKLEFLEVTKKGLSKLQILLIELETRHQDWQAGGLTTNHFLSKLKEANWQLEQYEASAPPPGWVCCWDRDYRRYFYTHKLTGKNQWDYPDADDIRLEDEQAKTRKNQQRKSQETESEISSTSDKRKNQFTEKEILASMSLPPPPPPPAEEHPSVKSLQLMYGSSSESESEEPAAKKAKKVAESLQNVPLPPEEKKEKHDKHDKHDKHSKKKKKKEKSKKKDKDKERTETGVVGPVGPMYPAGPFQPPPPPPDDGATSISAQPQVSAASSEIPVYGSFGDVQSGQNDQPLEFGTVPEPGPTLYEGMEGVKSGVISQGPQITPTTHEQDSYSSVAQESTVEATTSEVTHGEGPSDTLAGAQHGGEEKKKKKKDKMGTGSISLKKKHVSSMVQKWQKVKKEVELEEQHRQVREAEIRRKLAELE